MSVAQCWFATKKEPVCSFSIETADVSDVFLYFHHLSIWTDIFCSVNANASWMGPRERRYETRTDPGREQSPPWDTPPPAVGRKYQNIYQKWRRPPDSHSNTYAALDVKNQSPDYDTLMMLKPAASDRHPAV
ncbi:uncharacterized protein LOC125739110 isoform X5 [Brienomyrus brachyistius]|uniref:uncharacterized protein LOC125739110 isoform X5 n=1 Tax=Brienomyrus brachyistius TaxID=42636 RepID=UPI0020B2180A|nr:uncharacterized protein LOC125739110 isoform X5 [Brienomyrus brachyistius]